MPYSVYARQAILNWFWRGAPFTPVTVTYLALLSQNPSDDTGTGLTELTASAWTSYARTSISATAWTAPSGTSPQTIGNTLAVTPPGTAASALTLSGFAVYDAATAGNFLGWGSLNSLAIPTGDGVTFGPGVLTIQE